ncbi:Zinc finger C2H2 [Penicillium fimorum]|uniref:Zinc finger C2H2 n=1 Tax=Penicillium fimorum TaxID=1882269 RepID=A0A9W9Y3E5_9EURO|nr:Zinc finger C2H2 [Penicillium fimorum]
MSAVPAKIPVGQSNLKRPVSQGQILILIKAFREMHICANIESMEGPKNTKPTYSVKRNRSGSQDESSTTGSLTPGNQYILSERQDLQEQRQDFISASSSDSSPQLENSNVTDLRQRSRVAPGSDRFNLFQSRLQQLQDTLDTPMSRWSREEDQIQELTHRYAPLGRPVKETVLENESDRKGNASQGPSQSTKPNFNEQVVGEHGHPVIMTTTAPAASISTTNISSVVAQCLKDLSQLVSEDLSSFASEVPPTLWKDELGRLRVWAANIGAHQTGQSSLDHRLRDASHIKEQTRRILQRLERITEDINDVLHHSPEDDDFSDLSGDEDDDGDRTEMQSIYHALRDTINNLFKMSMVIRQPAPHDRLLGTKRSDTDFYEPYDRGHVMEKYPQAGEDILNRLGLAISQRRAVMRCRERHRIKPGQGLNHVIVDQVDGQSAIISDTVATELMEVSLAERNDLELLIVASQTSYAQTILKGAEGTTMLPSPPKDSADGAPFECPYCFVIITIANRRAWARHVFSDLMPYLCIFPGCPTPHRLYASRRGWFSHLQSQHSIFESSGLHVDCPLCLSSVPSGKQFERHVGQHLEELALFVLPRSEGDSEEEAAISSDEDSDTSHRLIAKVNDDEEMKTTSKQHILGAEDTIDLPDYDSSHSDHSSSSEPSEDRYTTKEETRPQDILEPESDPESTKEDKFPKDVNLEVNEPTISADDTPDSGRRSSKDHSLQINKDGFSYTTDYIEDHTATQPIHADENELDENDHTLFPQCPPQTIRACLSVASCGCDSIDISFAPGITVCAFCGLVRSTELDPL